MLFILTYEQHNLTLKDTYKKLGRETICFSNDKEIHEDVIGTFINKEFFGKNHFCAAI